MISTLVALTVSGLVIAVIAFFARDDGPKPADIAVAYELAWDRLDFDAIWALSGDELRDGLDRHRYVAAKRTAYAGRTDLGNLVQRVDVARVDVGTAHAVVRTCVTLRDGGAVHNDVTLSKRSSSWVVTGYELATSPAKTV